MGFNFFCFLRLLVTIFRLLITIFMLLITIFRLIISIFFILILTIIIYGSGCCFFNASKCQFYEKSLLNSSLFKCVLIFLNNIWKINFIFEFSILSEEHEPITTFQKDISTVKECCHVNLVFVVSNKIGLNRIWQRVYHRFELFMNCMFVNNSEFVVSIGFVWTLNEIPLTILEIFHIENSACIWDIIVEIEDFGTLNQISFIYNHFSEKTAWIFKLVPVFVLD